jgi:hypothetical protein
VTESDIRVEKLKNGITLISVILDKINLYVVAQGKTWEIFVIKEWI